MKKILKGKVISNAMKNTVVVSIERKTAHPLYKKLMKTTKNQKADTAGLEITIGSVVTIEQTRPLSKDKNFKVLEVISKGDGK